MFSSHTFGYNKIYQVQVDLGCPVESLGKSPSLLCYLLRRNQAARPPGYQLSTISHYRVLCCFPLYRIFFFFCHRSTLHPLGPDRRLRCLVLSTITFRRTSSHTQSTPRPLINRQHIQHISSCLESTPCGLLDHQHVWHTCSCK